VAEDVAFAGALQIKVSVVGEVDDCGFIRGGGVIDLQLVLIGEGVDHFGGQSPGEAFLAILADVSELDGRPLGGGRFADLPQLLAESERSAVQRIGAVIDGRVVSLALQRELRAADAVAVAADEGAEPGSLAAASVESARAK
jgi:hypothetical protein